MTVSEKLRQAIAECGLSPNALAIECNLDPGIIARFVAKKRGLSIESLDLVAEALDLRLVEDVRPRRRRRS